MTGKDLLKKQTPIIPESSGLVLGLVYFSLIFLLIPLIPISSLSLFLAALLSLFSMLFLGFADDILDIRWRVKIWLPLIASIPLLAVYFNMYGLDRTFVLVPKIFIPIFSTKLLHLSYFYYIYMASLCVFTTNSINILAGVNGVEGGQAIVIATSIAITNYIRMQSGDGTALIAHGLSFSLLVPFIGVTFAYLRYNKLT